MLSESPLRVRRAPSPPDPKTLPLDGCDMLLCMHVEDALPLTDLAEIGPCSLQEAMERVGRMVELGVLELIVDDEPPVLAHYPLPALLRSVAPANASEPVAAAEGGSEVSSIRPSSPAARLPSARPVPLARISVRPSLRASRPPREAAREAAPEASNDDDDSPPTGVRPRFAVDRVAARRALLGAVVLERRAGVKAEAAGAQRVRRRANSPK